MKSAIIENLTNRPILEDRINYMMEKVNLKEADMRKDENGSNKLHWVARRPVYSLFWLKPILDLLPKEQLLMLINEKNENGHTVLHVVISKVEIKSNGGASSGPSSEASIIRDILMALPEKDRLAALREKTACSQRSILLYAESSDDQIRPIVKTYGEAGSTNFVCLKGGGDLVETILDCLSPQDKETAQEMLEIEKRQHNENLKNLMESNPWELLDISKHRFFTIKEPNFIERHFNTATDLKLDLNGCMAALMFHDNNYMFFSCENKNSINKGVYAVCHVVNRLSPEPIQLHDTREGTRFFLEKSNAHYVIDTLMLRENAIAAIWFSEREFKGTFLDGSGKNEKKQIEYLTDKVTKENWKSIINWLFKNNLITEVYKETVLKELSVANGKSVIPELEDPITTINIK